MAEEPGGATCIGKAEEHVASNTPEPRRTRRYVRRRKFRFTEARRAAAKANLAKARGVLRERGWPHSEKQRAAARENIKMAQAAVHERGLPTTEARRAAMMANLAKANAALRERGYPRTEKQRQAARANFEKAWEVLRDPVHYDRCHGHKLKHGFFARRLGELMLGIFKTRLGRRRRGQPVSGVGGSSLTTVAPSRGAQSKIQNQKSKITRFSLAILPVEE
jgi:hypothetical protein